MLIFFFFFKVFHCVHLEAPAQVPLDPSLVEIDQEISKLNVTKELVSIILLHLRNSFT